MLGRDRRPALQHADPLYAGFQLGNLTGVIGYSVTCATANVIFSLLGPVVVVLAAALGTS